MIGFVHAAYRNDAAAIIHLTVKRCQFHKRPTSALIAKAFDMCHPVKSSLLERGLYNT